MMDTRPFFRHIVIEAKCDSSDLDSLDWVNKKIISLLNKLKINIVSKLEHKFSPQGISSVYILSSSHLAVHTWPENKYLHIDLITCSRDVDFRNLEKFVHVCFGNEVSITFLKY